MDLEIRITRIHLPTEYDVHFGKALSASKIEAQYVFAEITPSYYNRKPYKILIVVPEVYCWGDKGRSFAADILNLFLDEKDKYKLTSISYNKAAQSMDNSTAVIAFDPKDDTKYFWLRPPKHEAN